MPAPKPRIFVKTSTPSCASGLMLSEEQKSELHAAYGYIEAMCAACAPVANARGAPNQPSFSCE